MTTTTTTPVTTEAPSPVRMLAQVVYDAAANITGIVGLTPLELIGVVLGLFVIATVVQLILAATGKRGWTLEEDEA